MDALSVSEIESFLAHQRNGRLGCHLDGLTYVVPLMFAREGDYLYCYTIEGQKISMMRANPRVCFEVDELLEEGSWTSVIAQGFYEELDEDGAHHALKVLGHESPSTGESKSRANGAKPIAFRIRIASMSGRKVVRS